MVCGCLITMVTFLFGSHFDVLFGQRFLRCMRTLRGESKVFVARCVSYMTRVELELKNFGNPRKEGSSRNWKYRGPTSNWLVGCLPLYALIRTQKSSWWSKLLFCKDLKHVARSRLVLRWHRFLLKTFWGGIAHPFFRARRVATFFPRTDQ